MGKRTFSLLNQFFFRTLVLTIFFVFFFASCTPTNEALTDLVGGETKTTVNGPIGNSALSFSPSLKDFGALATNSGSSSQTFIVTNTSTYNVTLGAITGATTHFSINSGTCINHSTLSKNDTCTFSVTFAPTASGQFSTAVTIPYDTSGSGSFYSAVSVIGSGTNLTSFAGLDSLSNVTVTSMKLNWTDVAGADSYQAYQMTTSGAAVLLSSMSQSSACVAGACSYTAGGLNPSTTYSFRVRATDSNTVQEQNIVSRSNTTLAGILDLSGPAISLAGDCTTFQIITRDASNAAINMTTDTAITISGLGNGGIYTTSGCAVSLSSPIVLSGQNTKTFYYKNTTAQAITMAASLTTYTGDTLAHTISNNVADHLEYVAGNNQTANINALTSSDLEIRVVDAYANPVSGINLSFLSTAGGGVANSCVLTSNGSGMVLNKTRLGFTDIKNKIKVTKVGGPLPDAAGSGNATYTFTATSQNTNSGVFNGRVPLKESGAGLCSGDFNKDGKLDLAGVGETTNVVSVTINNGNGTFATRVDYNTVAYPYNCTSADANGDTFPDLIVANYATGGASSSVSVFINSGTGTFPTRVDYTTASSGMTDVKLADFNGDTILDMVSVGYTASTLNIRIGVGDGTFGVNNSYATGTNPISLVTGDFNGDGKLDVATTNYGAASVSVMRGNGDGTFQVKQDYTIGTQAFNLVAHDFNSDGRLDIATGNFASNTMSVLLGTGAAGSYTFLAKSDYALPAGPGGIAKGDFNGDGVIDLVVGSYTGSVLSLWAGVGNGTFSSRTDFPVGAGTTNQDLEAGDFDGNGKTDVAVMFRTATISAFNILLQGTGTTGLRPAQVDLATAGIGYYLTSGDFNGDNKPDIVHANYLAAGKASVFLNNGDGTGSFATKSDLTTGNYAAGIAVGDLNNDNKQDIVVCDRNNGTGTTVSVIIGNGDGTFVARVPYTTAVDPWSVALGDVNNDGRLDIVTGNYTTGNISVLLGNGDGTFQNKTDYATSANPRKIILTDVNNDKKLDVVLTSTSTLKAGVLIGNGSGGFSAITEFNVGGNGFHASVGDFNGDGNVDIVTTSSAGNNIAIILGAGNGSFGAPTTFPAIAAPKDIIVGDFNGDSKLDVYVSAVGTLSFFAGNGLGSFAARVDTLVQPTSTESLYGLTSGDFNGDGKQDIAVNSSTTAKVYIIYGL